MTDSQKRFAIMLAAAAAIGLSRQDGGCTLPVPAPGTRFAQERVDSAQWAQATGRPSESPAVAKVFVDSAAKWKNSSEKVAATIPVLSQELQKCVTWDAAIAWAPFRSKVTERMRQLRTEGKVDDTAKSHADLLQAIGEGVSDSIKSKGK